MASYNDVEKEVPKVDYLERTVSDENNDARINRFTPEEQRKIIRRVDRRLVLTLGFLYCVSLMDRTNLGIAVVAGMGVDLLLTGPRYSIIVLVFFLTYVILQVTVEKSFDRQMLTIVAAPSDRHFAKAWPTNVPSNHHSTLGHDDDLLCFLPGLDYHDSTSSRSRNFRGWLLPGLCLSPELLVSTIRSSET
jgi:hypothetical protein